VEKKTLSKYHEGTWRERDITGRMKLEQSGVSRPGENDSILYVNSTHTPVIMVVYYESRK
jgi:hypothetical protein